MREGFRGTAAKITEVYLVLLVTLYLFYTGAEGYSSIIRSKFSLMCVMTALYVLSLASAALFRRVEMPRLPELARGSTWPQRFALLYLLLVWISAVASEHWAATVIGASRHEGALTQSIYCINFLLVSSFARPNKRLLCIFGAAVLAFCALCGLQFLGLNPLGLYPEGMNYYDAYVKYSGEYLGSIGNSGLVSAFFCLAAPILWIGVLRLEDRRRWLMLLPLAALIAVLFFSGVLAGLVGVLCGGVLLLPFVLRLSGRGRRRAGLALAALAALCFLLILHVDPGVGLAHELHELLNGRPDADFGSGRLHIWAQVLARVPQRPLLGHGPDTMALYGIEGFSRYDETLKVLLRAGVDTAHSEYLNLLFHQGILGLAAYLALLAACAGSFVRRGLDDPGALMLAGAVFCYCVQALFGISMCPSALFFWVALGLLAARLRPEPYIQKNERFCPRTASF